jgi:hypothetical protein
MHELNRRTWIVDCWAILGVDLLQPAKVPHQSIHPPGGFLIRPLQDCCKLVILSFIHANVKCRSQSTRLVGQESWQKEGKNFTNLPCSMIRTCCKSMMVETRCAIVMTVMLEHSFATVSFSITVVCGSTFAVHSSRQSICVHWAGSEKEHRSSNIIINYSLCMRVFS